MKFKGNGIVWDAKKNCILCKFKDGEFETEDIDIAEKLSNAGYKFEGELKKAAIPDERTVKDLKTLLDEKGIEYDPKSKKQDLIELVKTLESEKSEEDSIDENENTELEGAE